MEKMTRNSSMVRQTTGPTHGKDRGISEIRRALWAARTGRIPALLNLAFSEHILERLQESLGDRTVAESRILDLVQQSIRPPRTAGFTWYTSEAGALTLMRALHPRRQGTPTIWRAAIFDLRPGADSAMLGRYPYVALVAEGEIPEARARILPAVVEALRGWGAFCIVVTDEEAPEERWEALTQPLVVSTSAWTRVIRWGIPKSRPAEIHRSQPPRRRKSRYTPQPEPALLLCAEPV